MIMSRVILQAWKAVKPHIPMIKFRKGSPSAVASNAVEGSVQAPKGGQVSQVSNAPIIEDWQLPPKYKRQVLDQKEIDAINSGGAY